MNTPTFELIVNARLERCRETLKKKAQEYAKDCIFSFEEALAIDGAIKFKMGDKMEANNEK